MPRLTIQLLLFLQLSFLGCISGADDPVVENCSFANMIMLVRTTTPATASREGNVECSLCIEKSKVKVVLAGSAALTTLLAAPALAAGAMAVVGVTATGPVAGGLTAWLMSAGGPAWLYGLFQSVGMAGLSATGAALWAIGAGGGVLLIMNGQDHICASFRCGLIPEQCFN
ncbi:hypothetical protein BV898_16851 [Hypsibius exemplaris]|uniref:Uncharacterized protein n=1 Tax=Hypsibius exemplaris TaxID=2072580 RepID=A0A9X6NDY9_HYPEX|nr:hypothetical protein BV898_16851 [Hypsibius exemplaris]